MLESKEEWKNTRVYQQSLDVNWKGILDFPGNSAGEESTCNERDLGSIPGLEKSPGEGHGNPLQYSCLENPMDRGAWWAWATVYGVT